jgi:hypothetical protein
MKLHLPMTLAVLNLAWAGSLMLRTSSVASKDALAKISDSSPSSTPGSNSSRASANISVSSNGTPPSPKTPIECQHPTPTPFHWSHLESSDYKMYMANLRAVGCPEQTVRDIVFADIRGLFHQVHLQAISPPVTNNAQLPRETGSKVAALVEEERQVLNALGIQIPTWASPLAMDVAPIAGTSRPTEAKFIEIASRVSAFQRKRENIMAKFENRDPNPEDLASLAEIDTEEQQLLASELTPDEREKYDILHSPASVSLRDSLGNLELSAEEFQLLYDVRKQFDAALVQTAESGAAMDISGFEAETQRILGPERFARFTGEALGESSTASN